VTRSRGWQHPAWYAYPAGRLRFLGDRIGLPNDLTCRGIERYDTAAKLTAFVFRICTNKFLSGGNSNVDGSLLISRRIGDHGRRMVVDMHLPDKFARGCIERIHVRLSISKENDWAGAVADNYPRTDRRCCGKIPVQATAFRIESINFASSRGDEETSCGDYWLATGIRDIAEVKGPAELQLGNIRQGESGLIAALKARVCQACTKAVPARADDWSSIFSALG